MLTMNVLQLIFSELTVGSMPPFAELSLTCQKGTNLVAPFLVMYVSSILTHNISPVAFQVDVDSHLTIHT